MLLSPFSKAEYPETDPFLSLVSDKSITVDADKKLVPSGLFAYFSCSDSSLFLNVDTLDLDQDGMFGIQCIGGAWDLDSLPAQVNDTCITTAKCKPRSPFVSSTNHEPHLLIIQ